MKTALATAFAAGAFAASAALTYPIRLAEGPLLEIDGVISPHAGFLNATPPKLLSPGNEGTALFLTDGRTLFVAWRVKARNIDIGGGLRAKAAKRDGAVWEDDCVELAVESEDREKRVAHFIFNPAGIIYDRLVVGSAKPDNSWNCKDIKVASKVLHGWWEIEAAIPLAEIGTFEKGVSVNAARSSPGDAAASITASSVENMNTVRRGDIYYADLSPVVGSEQGGMRPVLIVQNDMGNRYSPTVIAAAITSRKDKTQLPTHIQGSADGCGLVKDSIVLLEQIRTLDKRRLKEHMGSLGSGEMSRVNRALRVSFGL